MPILREIYSTTGEHAVVEGSAKTVHAKNPHDNKYHTYTRLHVDKIILTSGFTLGHQPLIKPGDYLSFPTD